MRAYSRVGPIRKSRMIDPRLAQDAKKGSNGFRSGPGRLTFFWIDITDSDMFADAEDATPLSLMLSSY